MYERDSDGDILDHMDAVLALLVSRGCGAREAMLLCTMAAAFTASWVEEHVAAIGVGGEEAFEDAVSAARDLPRLAEDAAARIADQRAMN
jgi:hypothetical protein